MAISLRSGMKRIAELDTGTGYDSPEPVVSFAPDLRLRVRVTNPLAIVMEAERSFIDYCGRELEELRALHKDRRRMDKAPPARRRVAA